MQTLNIKVTRKSVPKLSFKWAINAFLSYININNNNTTNIYVYTALVRIIFTYLISFKIALFNLYLRKKKC